MKPVGPRENTVKTRETIVHLRENQLAESAPLTYQPQVIYLVPCGLDIALKIGGPTEDNGLHNTLRKDTHGRIHTETFHGLLGRHR